MERQKPWRQRLYEVVETSLEGNHHFHTPMCLHDWISNLYDWFMMLVILASVVPLAFKTEYPVFTVMEAAAAVIFIADYLLRLITADYKLGRGRLSFVIYPFTPMAILDLLCILPSVHLLSESFRLLKLVRLLRTLRAFRVFKAVRYSKSIRLLKGVFHTSRKPLFTVGLLALGYILISALVVFNAEPETFETFFDAVYWATVSLTTMGYGDIYPVTTIGRIITMVSSIFGIAIIALPSGIITAGLMAQISAQEREEKAGQTPEGKTQTN